MGNGNLLSPYQRGGGRYVWYTDDKEINLYFIHVISIDVTCALIWLSLPTTIHSMTIVITYLCGDYIQSWNRNFILHWSLRGTNTSLILSPHGQYWLIWDNKREKNDSTIPYRIGLRGESNTYLEREKGKYRSEGKSINRYVIFISNTNLVHIYTAYVDWPCWSHMLWRVNLYIYQINENYFNDWETCARFPEIKRCLNITGITLQTRICMNQTPFPLFLSDVVYLTSTRSTF